MEQLSFLLTKTGFTIDEAAVSSGDELTRWKAAFTEAPYETLYALAFQERPACFDASGAFLFRLSEGFAEELAATPGLELTREKTEVLPGEGSLELLLDSVPFVLGAEFVTKAWIRHQYKELQKVFRNEIRHYSGKVSLYLSEKSQKLSVPERVFFHLVESKDEAFPFAFLGFVAQQAEHLAHHAKLHKARAYGKIHSTCQQHPH